LRGGGVSGSVRALPGFRMVLKAVAETRDGAGNALSKRTKSPRRAHPVGEFGPARQRMEGPRNPPHLSPYAAPRQMGQCQVACDRQYPGRQATELWIELASISPHPQKCVLRDILRSRAVEPQPTQIREYPALVRLDDAAKGRVIATSGLADVRVKFQGAAPDLPHILAGGRKGYRLTRGLFRVAAYREPKERDWAQPRQFGET
jgi:hypothetical protein